MIAGLIATVLQSFAVLPIPLLVRRGIDVAIPRHDRAGLAFVAGSIVALTAATGILATAAQRWVQNGVKEATARLRERIADQVFRADFSSLGDFDGAETQERLLNDTSRIEQWATTAVRQSLPAVLTVVGLVIVLFRIDPTLTLVTAIVAPLIVATTRGFRSLLSKVLSESQAAFEDLGRGALVAIRAQPLIRSRGASWSERMLLHQRVMRVKDASSRRNTLSSLIGASQTTVVSLASAITLGVGGNAVMSGRLSLGALLSFFASVALIRQPITTLATMAPAFVEGRQSEIRIDAFLAAVPLGPPLIAVDSSTPAPSRLELADVSYAYPGGENVLEHLDFVLEPGQVLALAGPNGAGKTTLMALLLGLLKPVSGQVLVDGRPVDSGEFEQIRQHLGVSFQHSQFFPGTVRQNLLYGRPLATEADLDIALREAEADVVVARIPDGLDGWIGGDGDRLSGGERQRLAIARALIARPPILVLDEPSNHLPVTVVERILSRVRAWPTPPAVLLISHDSAVLAKADRTIRVPARIVQSGNGETPAIVAAS